MNTRTAVGIVIVVAIAAAGVVLFVDAGLSSLSGNDSPERDSSKLIATAASTADRLTNAVDASVSAKAEKRRKWLERLAKFDPYEGMSAEERKLCEELESAQSDEDFRRVQVAAEKALKSENPAVRQNAVEALSWFGEKALPELTPLMVDKDEDVAQAAMNAWESALSEIESAQQRVNTARIAMTTIADRDALAMIGAQFSNAAQEWIDATSDESVASERRVSVIQTVVDVLEGDRSNVRLDAAREVYEEITGHAWAGIEEAEKYLANPEEYEPPEDADGKQK